MDVNYYLHREQVERMRADQAASSKAADAHRGLANLYHDRIAAHRATNAGPAAGPMPIPA